MAERLAPAAREDVLPDRTPALRLLGSARVREHEPALEKGNGAVDRLPVGGSEQTPNLRPGQRLVVEYDLSDLASPSARLHAFRDWAHEAIGLLVYRLRGWV